MLRQLDEHLNFYNIMWTVSILFCNSAGTCITPSLLYVANFQAASRPIPYHSVLQFTKLDTGQWTVVSARGQSVETRVDYMHSRVDFSLAANRIVIASSTSNQLVKLICTVERPFDCDNLSLKTSLVLYWASEWAEFNVVLDMLYKSPVLTVLIHDKHHEYESKIKSAQVTQQTQQNYASKKQKYASASHASGPCARKRNDRIDSIFHTTHAQLKRLRCVCCVPLNGNRA